MQDSNNYIQPKVQFAGFRRRFAAFIIDSFLIGCGLGFLQGIVFNVEENGVVHTNETISYAISFLAMIIYHGFFLSSKWQATPGKMCMGLYVVNNDGSKLSFFKAICRNSIGYIISSIILYFGFLMIAFTEKKTGLHDLIFGTYVVHGKRQR
jgi:uncharacterized RDD family membrane protein YckC